MSRTHDSINNAEDRDTSCDCCKERVARVEMRHASTQRVAAKAPVRATETPDKRKPIKQLTSLSLVPPTLSWKFAPHAWQAGEKLTLKILEMQFILDDEGFWRFTATYDCFASYHTFAYGLDLLSAKSQRALDSLGQTSFGGVNTANGYYPYNAPPVCIPGSGTYCPRSYLSGGVLYGQLERGAGTIEKEGVSSHLRYDFQRISTLMFEGHGYFVW